MEGFGQVFCGSPCQRTDNSTHASPNVRADAQLRNPRTRAAQELLQVPQALGAHGLRFRHCLPSDHDHEPFRRFTANSKSHGVLLHLSPPKPVSIKVQHEHVEAAAEGPSSLQAAVTSELRNV